MMQLADSHFRYGVLGLAAGLMLLLGTMRFCGEFSLPGKPPAPAVSVERAKSIAETIKLSSAAYDHYVEKDVASFGARVARARDMSTVFRYRADQEPHVLAEGETLEKLGLAITLEVGKLKGAKREHMLLTIENKSHKAIAYRVQTKPSAGSRSCKRMTYLRHNAVALPPGGKLTRAECVYRKGWTLEVSEIETVEVPELGFYYVSALDPEGIGLDGRTAKHHQLPHNYMSCTPPTSATRRNAIRSGEITWRDQIDYFARHRCKTYKFPESYRAFRKDGELPLPVSQADL